MFSFLLRIFYVQGWYIVTYALAIYHLNLFLAFLTPKMDPAMAEMDDEDGPDVLPTKQNEEFRPFIRRLPEFKFWYSATKATVIGFFCTFFELFNVPVFWPILVMYFITLFCITMKRQIKHMIICFICLFMVIQNKVIKYITRIGQNTGTLNSSKKVQKNPITVAFVAEYQNLNSGRRRMNGRNSSFCFVGKTSGPSSSSISAMAGSIFGVKKARNKLR